MPLSLVEVQKINEYSRVNVLVKVVSKRKPVKFDDRKMKQKVVVADSMTVTLWEDKVDMLESEKSY